MYPGCPHDSHCAVLYSCVILSLLVLHCYIEIPAIFRLYEHFKKQFIRDFDNYYLISFKVYDIYHTLCVVIRSSLHCFAGSFASGCPTLQYLAATTAVRHNPHNHWYVIQLCQCLSHCCHGTWRKNLPFLHPALMGKDFILWIAYPMLNYILRLRAHYGDLYCMGENLFL